MANSDSAPKASVGAVLLAAGESTRMDRPKQLLDWGGMPLLEYQIRQLLTTDVGQVVVVLGHLYEDLSPIVDRFAGPRLSVVINEVYRAGKTTSIRAGIAALATDVTAIVLLAVDQPRPAHLIQRLVDSHRCDANLLSVPSYHGKHGHPPVFDASLRNELLAITEKGQGIREVIQRHRQRLRDVPMDEPIVLANINTPEDYEQAKALSGGT